MSNQIASPVVNSAGKTRLRESLERAKRGEGPSVGQWLEFPGYSLARTVAPLGEDVSTPLPPLDLFKCALFGTYVLPDWLDT